MNPASTPRRPTAVAPMAGPAIVTTFSATRRKELAVASWCSWAMSGTRAIDAGRYRVPSIEISDASTMARTTGRPSPPTTARPSMTTSEIASVTIRTRRRSNRSASRPP